MLLAAGFYAVARPMRIARGDAMAGLAADRIGQAAGIYGVAGRRQCQHLVVAVWFQAVALPVRESTAAMRYRRCRPIALKLPPT
jgi:hypothetical protein